MRIRLLPSTAGGPKPQLLTTFVVDDSVAIDAGSIALSLAIEELRRIRHVIITHSHIDHTALLPIFVAEAFTGLTGPILVHATEEVIADLTTFLFNDHIWPDFQKIAVPGGGAPSLEFRAIYPRRADAIGHLTVTPIPVNHTAPCVGLLVDDGDSSVVFTSDTYTTDEIWSVASKAENLRAIFVDVSFPNELEELAEASRHFTPKSLAADLKKIRREVSILAVHIKPSNRDQVINQLAELGDSRISVAQTDRVYEW